MNGIFGIGIAELFFIAIIALIVLGPERLPSAMREGAKYFRMARNLSGELTSQFSEELKALDDINPQKIMNEFLEDPALDDINPNKIVKDLSADKAKAEGKKPTAKKAAAKKTTAKKPTTTATKKAADVEPTAANAASVALASRPLAEDKETEERVAEDEANADVETPPAEDSTPAASTSQSDGQAKETQPAEKPVSTNDAGNASDSTRAVEETAVEPPPENRIAPDELATNLEQEGADTSALPADSLPPDPLPSDAASLSVNGTHDSVEDRA